MDIATFKCAILSMSIGKGKKNKERNELASKSRSWKKSNKMILKKVDESK